MRAHVIAACVTAAVLSSVASALAARTPSGAETAARNGGSPPRSEIEALTRTVESLRDRVTTLESEVARARAGDAVAPTVQAPFTVVNGTGTPIFTVSDAAYDNAIRGRVHIGRGSSTNYVMWFHNASGSQVASMGESRYGIGTFILQKSGKEMAFITDEGFVFNNKEGKQLAHLGPDPTNKDRARIAVRGILELYDEKFNTVVDAGALDDGRGAVRTWPNQACRSFAGLVSPPCLRGVKP